MAKPWEPEAMDYADCWHQLIWSEMRQAGMDPDQVAPHRLAPAHTRAFHRYLLACYCQALRERWATPWEPLEEFKPAILMLVNTHHWRPDELQDCLEDELAFLLHQELAGFVLPEEAAEACRSLMNRVGISHVLAPHVNDPE